MPSNARQLEQSRTSSAPYDIVPWRDRPLIPVRDVKAIAGFSPATAYGLAAQGKLELVKLGGRTLIRTASLIALVESAEAWTPTDRVAPAVAARKRAAAAAWAE